MLFDIVCDLAKKKDAATIIENHSEICLDARKGFFTPIMFLAKLGEHDAVDFLMQQFDVSRHYAIFGYALGGYIEYVNKNLVDETYKHFALQGYAAGGNLDQVKLLATHPIDYEHCVFGYAFGGYEILVDQLINERRVDYNKAVWGYGLGGHVTCVNKLIARGGSIDWAIRGCAQHGDINQVNFLLELGASRDSAVWGFALGGHVKAVNECLAHHANPLFAARGYAHGGHVTQVNQLMIQENIGLDEIVSCYALYGHIKQVNMLIAQGANRRRAFDSYCSSNFIRFDNPNDLLRLMSLTDDDALRILLRKKHDNDFLFKRASNLNKLIRANHHSYLWALVWCEALQLLFYQGDAMMQKCKLPREIIFKISSFISGFLGSYEFLMRPHNDTNSQCRSSLFARQRRLALCDNIERMSLGKKL